MCHANIAQFTDQGSRPAIDVLLFYNRAHADHPVLSLRRTHIQRREDRICQAFRVVWVHDERVRQFASRACERTEDKHTIFIMAAGEKLFCDQVHPVVQ